MSSKIRILLLAAIAFAAGLVLANCHKKPLMPFNWDPSAEPVRISAKGFPLLVMADIEGGGQDLQGQGAFRFVKSLEYKRSDVKRLVVYELRPVGYWKGLKFNPCLPAECVVPPPPPNLWTIVTPRAK